jgi:hypothetical protein
MADVVAPDIPQKQKSPKSPIVVLIIGIMFILWLLMLFTSDQFYEDFGMNIPLNDWIFYVSAIMIVLIIVLLVTGFPSRTAVPQTTPSQFTSMSPTPSAAEPGPGVVISEVAAPAEPAEPAGAVMEAEPLVVEAEIVEVEAIEVEEMEPKSSLKMQKPTLVEYPKKVPGGVYGDTIVRVDPLTKLNLRTLLVRSCMICDRQGKCWDEFMDSIPQDEFLNNIDCKKGLRHIRGDSPEDERPKMLRKKTRRKAARR